jgi:PAB-dependent poly(A)-specific ribonuclease subunit 3
MILADKSGFRLTNESAIRSIQKWKRINNGNIVTVIDAFTNRSFGDSSLILVTDYHPLSKTLAETHLSASRFPRAGQATHVAEPVLWSYIVQITNALKAIHAAGLAARVIDPSKILVTGKNRIRLNACGILDVVQFDTSRSVQDMQMEDLAQFGRLILSLGSNSSGTNYNLSKLMEQFSRSYSHQLKDRVFWLASQSNLSRPETIETFAATIEGHAFTALDAQEHLNDQLTSELNRELENSRITRLMMKLNFITERPDYSHDRQWAETGERYPIKLFRDYVFHQVDAQGNPVLDMGHVLACLNKLDAGSDEKMVLTSRDEQIVLVVSYKEIKRAVDGAFGDLMRASRR